MGSPAASSEVISSPTCTIGSWTSRKANPEVTYESLSECGSLATMPDKGRRIATLTARLSLAGGGLLGLTGFVVPSSTLVISLRATPGDSPEQLLLGATLFKIGL